jgi:uncharacterized GH25 family protein
MRKIPLLVFFLAMLIYAFAHEYILVAYKFRVKKGDDLEVHLFVADGFNVQLERPFQKMITRKFELLTVDSTIDLTKQENGSLPVIYRKVNFDGGGLVHMERDYAYITLPTDKFLDYLEEDHIDGIAGKADRKKLYQKERYSRCIKALVQSGGAYRDSLYKKITGQSFEIVLLQNPYRLHKGDTITARILFQGKPLAGKIITARNRTGDKATITLTSRTDADGICSFPLSREGDWFLHATYMIPCPEQSDSDWESFWTSYSFAID